MPPSFQPPSEDHLVLLHQEVAALLAKGAIERVPVPEVDCGCYSHYFLIPRKDKGLRPIIDLRNLNYFLKKEKFKMLTLAQVLSALYPEDWMVALELQEAYFHIPILPAHRRYLRFVVGHKHFQFTVLPFGLTSAPRVFTKVMAVRGLSLPLPRRLAVEGAFAPDTGLTPPDYGEPPAPAGVHYQRAKVTPDSFSDAPFHRGSSGHSAVSGLSSPKASPRHSGYDSNLSALVLGFGETDSEAAGPLGLLHPASNTCQVAYAGSAVGPEVPVGAASGKSLRHGPDLREVL
ncbi:hypothetical protein NDU88_006651 [Pleurodeles waltl]|uniref:ribonuclease H n=1 Tax=Pleurodeles waltl TaxID=8319 RepID=A0AAV7RPK3_PLEWA|nr:hypothetical protein NDU88_006651 [Pleurodeles waltl]